MQNRIDQGRPVSNLTDIGCHPPVGYFSQPKDNRELMPLDQVSMAVQMIGQEVYPITPLSFVGGENLSQAVGDPNWLSQSDSPSDRADHWLRERQGGYNSDLSEVCYHNAATCPDCGQGMLRLGDQLACEGCGFGSCGV
jgi:hypothetical protein